MADKLTWIVELEHPESSAIWSEEVLAYTKDEAIREAMDGCGNEADLVHVNDAYRKLMKHQEGAIVKHEKHGFKNYAFLFEMRLGKTLAAIRAVKRAEKGREDQPCRCLVLAPITVMNAWENELELEGEIQNKAYQMAAKNREHQLMLAWHHSGRTWTLINHEYLRYLPQIANMPWDWVWIDESTRIKNPGAKITQICCDPIYYPNGKDDKSVFFETGFKGVRHRGILTGLIAPEDPLNVYCQFKYLLNGFLGCKNYWEFRNNYFEPASFGYGWNPKPGARQDIKTAVHEIAYVCRRQDVGMNKTKVYQKLVVPMNKAQLDLSKQIIEEFAYDYEKIEPAETRSLNSELNWIQTIIESFQAGNGAMGRETLNAMEKFMWLHRIAGGFDPEGKVCISTNKAEAILERIKQDMETDDQIVLWFKFKAELTLMADMISAKGIPFGVISGMVSGEKRSHELNKFRARKTRVLLATEKTAKFGVDCSTSDTAFYYSNEPSTEDRVQSEDRILHPMKQSPLLYVDVVSKDSVDEDLQEALRDKSHDAREFMTAFSTKLGRRLKIS
jgi:SNF2 family DNA or RNA helicase